MAGFYEQRDWAQAVAVVEEHLSDVRSKPAAQTAGLAAFEAWRALIEDTLVLDLQLRQRSEVRMEVGLLRSQIQFELAHLDSLMQRRPWRLFQADGLGVPVEGQVRAMFDWSLELIRTEAQRRTEAEALRTVADAAQRLGLLLEVLNGLSSGTLQRQTKIEKEDEAADWYMVSRGHEQYKVQVLKREIPKTGKQARFAVNIISANWQDVDKIHIDWDREQAWLDLPDSMRTLSRDAWHHSLPSIKTLEQFAALTDRLFKNVSQQTDSRSEMRAVDTMAMQYRLLQDFPADEKEWLKDQIMGLYREVFGPALGITPSDDFEDYRRSGLSVVAYTGEGPAKTLQGFVLVRNSDSIDIMAVRQAARRRGTATQLLKQAALGAQAKQLPSLRLQVFEHNSAALQLYQTLGFSETGRKKGLASNGEAGVLVSLSAQPQGVIVRADEAEAQRAAAQRQALIDLLHLLNRNWWLIEDALAHDKHFLRFQGDSPDEDAVRAWDDQKFSTRKEAVAAMISHRLAAGKHYGLRINFPEDEEALFRLLAKLDMTIDTSQPELWDQTTDREVQRLRSALPKAQQLAREGYDVRTISSPETTLHSVTGEYIYAQADGLSRWPRQWIKSTGHWLAHQGGVSLPLEIYELVFNVLEYGYAGALGLKIVQRPHGLVLEAAVWDAGPGIDNPQALLERGGQPGADPGAGFRHLNAFPGEVILEALGQKWIKSGAHQSFRLRGESLVTAGQGTKITLRLPVRSEMREKVGSLKLDVGSKKQDIFRPEVFDALMPPTSYFQVQKGLAKANVRSEIRAEKSESEPEELPAVLQWAFNNMDRGGSVPGWGMGLMVFFFVMTFGGLERWPVWLALSGVLGFLFGAAMKTFFQSQLFLDKEDAVDQVTILQVAENEYEIPVAVAKNDHGLMIAKRAPLAAILAKTLQALDIAPDQVTRIDFANSSGRRQNIYERLEYDSLSLYESPEIFQFSHATLDEHWPPLKTVIHIRYRSHLAEAESEAWARSEVRESDSMDLAWLNTPTWGERVEIPSSAILYTDPGGFRVIDAGLLLRQPPGSTGSEKRMDILSAELARVHQRAFTEGDPYSHNSEFLKKPLIEKKQAILFLISAEGEMKAVIQGSLGRTAAGFLHIRTLASVPDSIRGKGPLLLYLWLRRYQAPEAYAVIRWEASENFLKIRRHFFSQRQQLAPDDNPVESYRKDAENNFYVILKPTVSIGGKLTVPELLRLRRRSENRQEPARSEMRTPEDFSEIEKQQREDLYWALGELNRRGYLNLFPEKDDRAFFEFKNDLPDHETVLGWSWSEFHDKQGAFINILLNRLWNHGKFSELVQQLKNRVSSETEQAAHLRFAAVVLEWLTAEDASAIEELQSAILPYVQTLPPGRVTDQAVKAWARLLQFIMREPYYTSEISAITAAILTDQDLIHPASVYALAQRMIEGRYFTYSSAAFEEDLSRHLAANPRDLSKVVITIRDRAAFQTQMIQARQTRNAEQMKAAAVALANQAYRGAGSDWSDGIALVQAYLELQRRGFVDEAFRSDLASVPELDERDQFWIRLPFLTAQLDKALAQHDFDDFLHTVESAQWQDHDFVLKMGRFLRWYLFRYYGFQENKSSQPWPPDYPDKKEILNRFQSFITVLLGHDADRILEQSHLWPAYRHDWMARQRAKYGDSLSRFEYNVAADFAAEFQDFAAQWNIWRREGGFMLDAVETALHENTVSAGFTSGSMAPYDRQTVEITRLNDSTVRFQQIFNQGDSLLREILRIDVRFGRSPALRITSQITGDKLRAQQKSLFKLKKTGTGSLLDEIVFEDGVFNLHLDVENFPPPLQRFFAQGGSSLRIQLKPRRRADSRSEMRYSEQFQAVLEFTAAAWAAAGFAASIDQGVKSFVRRHLPVWDEYYPRNREGRAVLIDYPEKVEWHLAGPLFLRHNLHGFEWDDERWEPRVKGHLRFWNLGVALFLLAGLPLLALGPQEVYAFLVAGMPFFWRMVFGIFYGFAAGGALGGAIDILRFGTVTNTFRLGRRSFNPADVFLPIGLLQVSITNFLLQLRGKSGSNVVGQDSTLITVTSEEDESEPNNTSLEKSQETETPSTEAVQSALISERSKEPQAGTRMQPPAQPKSEDNQPARPAYKKIEDMTAAAGVFIDAAELELAQPAQIARQMDELMTLLSRHKDFHVYIDGIDDYPLENIHNAQLQKLLTEYRSRIHMGMLESKASLQQQRILVQVSFFEGRGTAAATREKIEKLKKTYDLEGHDIVPLEYTQDWALKGFLDLAESLKLGELIKDLPAMYAVRTANGYLRMADTYLSSLRSEIRNNYVFQWSA